MSLPDPQPLFTPTVGLVVDDPFEAAVVRARLRRLVAATQAVGDEFALPFLYRRIAETARSLVDAEHVALGVLSTAGAATRLVQLEAEDSSGGARPEDEHALLSLATTAGIAIENARFYEESRRRQEWGREAIEISNRRDRSEGQDGRQHAWSRGPGGAAD